MPTFVSLRASCAALRTLRSGLGILLLAWACSLAARADVALFLEEPYSFDGALAGTGHVAVYLDNVCATTPVQLRACAPGEMGVVISRYRSIAGYDWIAVPLIPYLYAVEREEDVPLFVDARMVAFLRDQYRRRRLQTLAPDLPGGETPEGDWYQLAGSSYDRNIYGFQLATTREQDARLIEWLNNGPNRRHFSVIKRNCANFAAAVINFYYPHAVHRSVIGDLGVATPKQIAKSLVQYSRRHPDLRMTKFVVPQVLGTMRRSKPIRGVLESIFAAKKYMLPLLAIHPYFSAGLVAAHFVPRFKPAREALVMNARLQLDAPLDAASRRSYQEALDALEQNEPSLQSTDGVADWKEAQAMAEPDLDADGRPVVQIRLNDDVEQVGVTRNNVMGDGSMELAAKLLHARIRQELRSATAKKTAQSDVGSDLVLLRRILDSQDKATMTAAQDTAARWQDSNSSRSNKP